MNKYIHYCWFGGKPLPKLTKKCIKSWKKYLPDYEIIRWDESNCNINECVFVKEAYKKKKFAFVADYFRAKTLKEYGGIYFDTDMLIIKNIDFLLNDKSFLGIEDSKNIACGVWYEKEKDAFLPTYLYNFYKNLKSFNEADMFYLAIPNLVSKELLNYGFCYDKVEQIQTVKDIKLYPRDYFYPLSYDRKNNIFTDNTCMIHYYDASWVPNWQKRELTFIRLLGKKKAIKIIAFLRKIKSIIKRLIKILFFPYFYYKSKKQSKIFFNKRKDALIRNLKKLKKNSSVIIYNQDWLGTSFATKEIFDNTLPMHELWENDNFEFFAKKILEKKPKIIIFSAFAYGWDSLIHEIRKIDNNVIIKILWHGSNAVHTELYDFDMFQKIFDLLKENKIKSIGFVKKSMYELYKNLGYNVEFVENTVHLDEKQIKKKDNNLNSEKIKIGLYSSGDRWVKNTYNQLAAASLIKNAVIDIVPLSWQTKIFADLLKCNISGSYEKLPRTKLLERLAQNDINIYVTFVECAPITPLESLELGVPCITGNNHHYWTGTPLEKYLIVNEADNSIEIAKKIEFCLENKDEIIKLYKTWKKKQDNKSLKSVKKFLEI